ncbi:hypothetical protein H8J91_04310 [Clostridium perfringens]|nr:hypothetical protein [Clostridium perfringens]CAJ1763308.1 hypothetical protein AUSP0016_00003 [uncultured phage]CAJ1887735.1 hypothetical protein AUSP0015_00003 [uncultured phage]
MKMISIVSLGGLNFSMDLVTDFKEIIDENTEKTINSLKEIYIEVNEDKKYDFYKSISKYYTAINLWKKQLEAKLELNEKDKILLCNLNLNFCSLINCVVLGDEKLINFLYRNIIETILRFCTKEYESKDLEAMFKKICITDNINKKKYLEKYSSQLKSIYINSCHYVHTDTSKINYDLVNLIKYKHNIEEFDLKKENNNFCKMLSIILQILQIMYIDLFEKMKSTSKAYFYDLSDLEQRIEYKEILQSI